MSAENERRSVDGMRLDDLRAEFMSHKKLQGAKVDILCGFKNKATGVCLLGMLILTGSYLFTYVHMEQASNDYRIIQDHVTRVHDRTSDNSVHVAVLMSKIDTTNERLCEVIELIRSEGAD